MSTASFEVYRHSGKFNTYGPIVAILAALGGGMVLGFAYAYIMKWIPFIYVNFLLTLGYGFVLGFACTAIVKASRMRNKTVAITTSVFVSLIAIYMAWNGHIHSLIDGAPLLCLPHQVWKIMQILYENGSWGLRSGGAVTGIPLAIVWVIEAGMIGGFIVFMVHSFIADTPYCEQSQCWLDEEKKISTLAAFEDPEQLARLKAGDLGPLSQAVPRPIGSESYARLTLMQSPSCDLFCTVRIENVTETTDKNGSTTEKAARLTDNLILPSAMSGLISKFETFGTHSVDPSSLA